MLSILLNYLIHQICVILPYLSIAIVSLVLIQGITYRVFKTSIYNKIREALIYGK